MELRLRLRGSACNGWPQITVGINGHEHWHDDVILHRDVTIRFDAQHINHVQIRLGNKRNGPDVWDTTLDDKGNIIEDKYCVIESVMVDGMRCPWLAEPKWTLSVAGALGYQILDDRKPSAQERYISSGQQSPLPSELFQRH